MTTVAPPQPLPPKAGKAFFVYQHLVSFEETNVMGNVYFARYLSWQGRCREVFLQTHASRILEDLAGDLRLVTLNVSCTFHVELKAFDQVEMRMSLAHLRQHRIGLAFDYHLRRGDDLPLNDLPLAAQGFQEIGCMRLAADGLAPCAVPACLGSALEPFG